MITCIKRIGIKTVFTMGELLEATTFFNADLAIKIVSLEAIITMLKKENKELKQKLKEEE